MGGLGGVQLESAGQAEGSSHSGGRLGRFAADGVTFPQARVFSIIECIKFPYPMWGLRCQRIAHFKLLGV